MDKANIADSLKFDFLKRKEFRSYRQQKLYKELRSKIRTIAIYKGGGGLGDLVVGASFFRSFKQAFPDARVKYMGIIYPRFENIFKAITDIDGYIHYERPDKGKRIKEYFQFRKSDDNSIDLLVDTQRRYETSLWLRMLGSRYMLSSSPFLSNWAMPFVNYKKMHKKI